MKKIYFKPNAKVVELKTSCLLASSPDKAPNWDREYQAGFDHNPGTEDDFD